MCSSMPVAAGQKGRARGVRCFRALGTETCSGLLSPLEVRDGLSLESVCALCTGTEPDATRLPDLLWDLQTTTGSTQPHPGPRAYSLSGQEAARLRMRHR